MQYYRVTSDQDTERIEIMRSISPKYCAFQAFQVYGKKDMQVTVQEGACDGNGIFTPIKNPLTY